MKHSKQIMDAHKDSTTALGNNQDFSPFRKDKKGLGAASDENQENHNDRVDFINPGHILLLSRPFVVLRLDRPRAENLQENALERELERLQVVSRRVQITRMKHFCTSN